MPFELVDGGWLTTREGGGSCGWWPAPTRRLVELRVGVDEPDDLDRVAGQMRALDLPARRGTIPLPARQNLAT